MRNGTTTGSPVHLNVEALEDRTVLSSFGANRGLSVALANVVPNFGGNEYITGTGPGTPALVRIWSLDGTLLTSFRPFGNNFTGGVFVAAGNLDADNETELIVSTGAGTTGRVKVYEFGFGGLQLRAAFLPFGPNYSGGVEIAVGNVTGGRPQEIIVGQQSQGSQVKVFADISGDNSFQYAATRTFNPFGANYAGGVSLAAANLDTTRNSLLDPYDYNYAEVVVGKASFEPRIRIFDVQTPTVVVRATYLAFDTRFAANRQGVNVAAGNTDGFRGAEVYVAIKGSSRIRFFSGQTGIQLGEIFPFFATTSRMTNMTIAQGDDDFFDIYTPSDLIVVRADGPYAQVPVVYPGRIGSAAGLNGSRLAP